MSPGRLALAAPALVSAFEAKGESAEYVRFYCQYGVSAWLFLACLFVANTAFNNLGFPMLSMAFNWGRATLGTISFVTFGAHYGGVKGGLVGFALGCAVFGIIAVGVAYAATIRLAKGMERGDCLGSRPVGAIDRREAKTPQRGPFVALSGGYDYLAPVRRFAGRWGERLHGSRRGG